MPSSDDGTMTLGYLLHGISIILALVGIANAVIMRIVKKKRDSRLCIKMKLFATINGIVVVLILFVVFIMGILYFDKTTNALEKCILI